MQKDNTDKMATMKISKLMITMGIPMILSMMLQAVYNIVDSAFVGRIKGTGEAAPIVSFSYGMENKKRINEGIKCGIIYTTIIMIA